MGEEVPLRRSERLQELERKNKGKNTGKSNEFIYIFDEVDSKIEGTRRKRGRDRKKPSPKSLSTYSRMKDRRTSDTVSRSCIVNTGNHEEERRLTYRPPTISILGLASEKREIHINIHVPYRESLMRFAKRAGPVVEAHAEKYYEQRQALVLGRQQQVQQVTPPSQSHGLQQQKQEQLYSHGLLRETSQLAIPMSSESMHSLAPQHLPSNANSSTSTFQMPQQGLTNMRTYGNPSTFVMPSPQQNFNLGPIISTSALSVPNQSITNTLVNTSTSTIPCLQESYTSLLFGDTSPSASPLAHQNYSNMLANPSTSTSPLSTQNFSNMMVSSSTSTYSLMHQNHSNIFVNPSTSTYPLAHTNYSHKLVNPSTSTFPLAHQNFSTMMDNTSTSRSLFAHQNHFNTMVNSSTSTFPLAHPARPIHPNVIANPSTSTYPFAHRNRSNVINSSTSTYAMQRPEIMFKNILMDPRPNITVDSKIGASSTKGKNVIVEYPTKFSGLKSVCCNDGVRFDAGTSNATTFSVHPSLDLNLSIGNVDPSAEQNIKADLGKLQPTEGHNKGCQFLKIGIGPSNIDENFEGNLQKGQT